MPLGYGPIIDIPSNLPHLCDVWVMNTVRGDLGGRKPAPTVVTTNVEVFVQNVSRQEIDRYKKRGVLVTNVVYVAAGANWPENYLLRNLRYTIPTTVQFPRNPQFKVVAPVDRTTFNEPKLEGVLVTREDGDLDHVDP